MESITFLKIASEVLNKSNTPLSPMAIWEIAVQLGLDKQKGSFGKTPWKSISAQLYIDIRDNKESIFCQPSRDHYYLV